MLTPVCPYAARIHTFPSDPHPSLRIHTPHFGSTPQMSDPHTKCRIHTPNVRIHTPNVGSTHQMSDPHTKFRIRHCACIPALPPLCTMHTPPLSHPWPAATRMLQVPGFLLWQYNSNADWVEALAGQHGYRQVAPWQPWMMTSVRQLESNEVAAAVGTVLETLASAGIEQETRSSWNMDGWRWRALGDLFMFPYLHAISLPPWS